MAAKKGKDGRWRFRKWVKLLDGTRRRVTGTPTQNTRAAALEAERAAIELAIHPLPPVEKTVVREVPLFEDFAAEFMKTYVRTHNKKSERDTKESILRVHLTPFFGKKRLNEISVRDIELYQSTKLRPDDSPRTEGKVGRKTINNHLTILHKLLAVAKKWGHITVLPDIEWLKTPAAKFDFLDFAEADRLSAAAEGEWRHVITVALHTGLRQGELLALRWEDVDLVVRRLVVRQAVARGVVGTPKNNKRRSIDLSDHAVAALKAQRHLRGELVFCDKSGKMLTKGACKWPLWRACKKAGLRRVGWHVLRHTFASHLVMLGVPLRVVQELLGHATIEMTMRYSHLSPGVTQEAVKLLDGRLGKPWAKMEGPPRRVDLSSGELGGILVEAPGVETTSSDPEDD